MGFNLSFGNFSYPYLGAQFISVQKLGGFLIFLAQVPGFTSDKNGGILRRHQNPNFRIFVSWQQILS